MLPLAARLDSLFPMKHRFLSVLVALALACCQSIPPPRHAREIYAENGTIDSSIEARGVKMAIASGGKFSSAAGLKIFSQKGNIVDAAVAVAFCLAVERPHSLGLGGGGLMSLHLANTPEKNYFVDFRESAPRRSTRKMFLDSHGKPVAHLSQIGALSVGVPGFVAGLYDIHKRWGALPWKKVLIPAIRLARQGFPVYPSLAERIGEELETVKTEPYTLSILAPRGIPLKAGDIFVQKDLANTIELIARHGKKIFYEGTLAKKIAQTLASRNGILDAQDLKTYRVIHRKPLQGRIFDIDIVSAPPPSAGGALLIQWSNVLAGYPRNWLFEDGDRYLHLLSEMMKRGYADRSRYFGDPAFTQEPWEKVITLEYAERLRSTISVEKATPSSIVMPGTGFKETAGTTHASLMDDLGNAIGVTLSINDIFGARLALPGTGIFLNDTMDDFSISPGVPNVYGLVGGEANAIEPGKRPTSSTMPTILLKNSRPVLVIGGAGGSRITSSVSQVILNYLFIFPGDLKKSQAAPRIHHQWLPDALEMETRGFDERTRKYLAALGHALAVSPYFAKVQAVARDAESKVITAVVDPRDDGAGAAAQ